MAVPNSPHFPAAPVARPYSPRRAAAELEALPGRAVDTSVSDALQAAVLRVGRSSVAAAYRVLGWRDRAESGAPDGLPQAEHESDKRV